jgi:hypothetical protein
MIIGLTEGSLGSSSDDLASAVEDESSGTGRALLKAMARARATTDKVQYFILKFILKLEIIILVISNTCNVAIIT